MKKLFLILTFLFIPFYLNAQTIVIDERINDIYFANGIMNTEEDAWKSSSLLEKATLKDIYNGDIVSMKRETDFKLLYNHTYGLYADKLEAFNQKKAEHKYFWIVMEAFISIAGKTTKASIFTDAAKDEIADMIAQEVLNALKEGVITYGLEIIDQEQLKNVISALEKNYLKDKTAASLWSAISAASDILQNMDLNKQFDALTASISSGYQAIIVAHSEGNFFANDLDEKLNRDGKSWMKQYIKAISISNPANKIPFGGSHITYDNDPITIWLDRAEPSIPNPLRYRKFYSQYNYNGTLSDEDVLDIIKSIYSMSMPEECAVVLGFYFEEDISSSCYNNAGIALFDIANAKFNTFEYYMQEQFVSDIGTVHKNPSREYITNFLSKSITAFRTAPSQWKLKKKNNNCPASCSDKKREIEHKYSKAVNDMISASQLKVYPFSESGKLYPLEGWYAGDFIVSSDNDYAKAFSIEGGVVVMGNITESKGICYELKTIENDKPAKLLGTIKKDEAQKPTEPTSGYVEVSLSWTNADIDMDLKVSFPGVHDIQDECQLMEHFYTLDDRDVTPGLYPIYITYEANTTLNTSVKEMQDIVVTIKVPGATEARTVNLKTIDSSSHIADIKVEERKVEVVLRDNFQKSSTVLYYRPVSEYSVSGNAGYSGGYNSTLSSSGSWTSTYVSPPIKDYIYSIIWHISQALLGPLSGANINVYALEDYNLITNKGSNPVYSGISSYGSSIYTAGVINVPREITDSLDDDKLYIIEAKGGMDIDVNDDKVFDANPVVNTGTIRAVTSGSALKNIGFKLNILTEMAYQISKEHYDKNDISRFINKSDEAVKCLLNSDINLDNVTNTIDALYFTPYSDMDKLYRNYRSEFMPIINKIHNGGDIYKDSFKLYAKPLVAGGYFSINEDAPVGTIIGKMETDCVSESPVYLFTLSGTGSENFEVDGEGNLKVAKPLVYEDRRIYHFSVIGTNAYGDSPAKPVYITVTADNSPVITSTLTSYVFENMPNGSHMGTISVNDMGYPITSMRLEGFGAEYFSIDNNGRITVVHGENITLSDKVYNLRVIASNTFGDSASSPVTFTIHDDIPVIVKDISITIKDNIADGTVIGRPSYYPGLSNIKEFKLEGYGAENFNVSADGTIRVAQSANITINNSPYRLYISAENEQGISEPKTVTINVISSQVDNIVSLSSFSANIYDSAGNNFVVGKIAYSYGYTPPIAFSLSGAGSERFSINSNGVITLIDNTNLNAGDVFDLEANASNEYFSSTKSKVKITVIEDMPHLYDFSVSIVEGLEGGTAIGKVGYSYGINRIVEFEIIGNDDFTIDNSGIIKIKEGAVIDYDVKNLYTFTIKGVNAVGKMTQSSASVRIIDDAPVLTNTVLSIMENSYGGEVVGYVKVSSNGKSVITSFALSGEGAEKFNINEQGLIRLGIGAEIDYETKSVYNLRVVAINSHDTSNEANVTINVVNAPDQEPVLIPTMLYMDENSPAGTTVGNIGVYSNGADAIVSFVIEGVNSDWFDIDDTGKITVGENAVLDYEKKKTFNLKVKATNSYGYSALTDLTINLNDLPDTPPTIISTTLYVDENVPKGSFVGQLRVYGAGSSITSIEFTGDGSENFKVYANGTVVTVKDLDYEQKTSYSFIATASNEFFTSSAANVDIRINNLPDSPPILNDTSLSIYRETPVNKMIGVISVSSTIHCGITGYVIDDNSVFSIRDSGEVYTNAAITEKSNYTVNVYAKSSCGDSNIVKLTVNTQSRIIGQFTKSICDIILSSDDTKVFMTDYSGGNLSIVDVSNPANPTLISSINVGKYTCGIALSLDDTKAFVTNFYDGNLKIIDVSDPENPILISLIHVGNDVQNIVLSSDNTKAFVTDYDDGNLKIVDVNNPANPMLISSIRVGNYAYDIALFR
ncbi:MAG: cadherin domain-containing protein [Campylobacteraceae bacterium]|jgi:hypothetical protein|nr:cadherin domain-containing protein [Campylobacteraceae bacterium]